METINVNTYKGKPNYTLKMCSRNKFSQYVNEDHCEGKKYSLNFIMTQLFLGFRVNGSNPREVKVETHKY